MKRHNVQVFRSPVWRDHATTEVEITAAVGPEAPRSDASLSSRPNPATPPGRLLHRLLFWFGIGLFVRCCLACGGAAPAPWCDRAGFILAWSEGPIDCEHLRAGEERAAELIAEETGIQPARTTYAAARTAVYLRAANSWRADFGPMVGGSYNPQLIIVGADFHALAHELLHAIDHESGRPMNPDHFGWDANGFNRAGERFAAEYRR